MAVLRGGLFIWAQSYSTAEQRVQMIENRDA